MPRGTSPRRSRALRQWHRQAALLGQEVVTKDYEKVRIRIAFHPLEEKFEVSNPAIAKDTAWIPDVAKVFAPGAGLYEMVNAYCGNNAG